MTRHTDTKHVPAEAKRQPEPGQGDGLPKRTASERVEALRAAARRASLLAGIARDRADGHHGRRDLLKVAERLDGAAEAFLAAVPAASSGNLMFPYSLPPAAVADLWRAGDIVRDRPDAGFPDEVLHCITAPVTGGLPQPPDLHPASPALARKEEDLRARLAAVLRHIDSPAEDTARAALDAVLDLYRQHARLARAVEADNARPCNRS